MDEAVLAELLRIRAGIMALQIQILDIQIAAEKAADPSKPEPADRYQALMHNAARLQKECLRTVLEQGPDIHPDNLIPFLRGKSQG